jgi:hypothetical protein
MAGGIKADTVAETNANTISKQQMRPTSTIRPIVLLSYSLFAAFFANLRVV